MNTTINSSRFSLQAVTITDADGVDRKHQVIVDRSTYGTDDTDGIEESWITGYVRCQGKQCVAVYGKNSAIYSGSDDDVYYAPVSRFGSTWSHVGPTSRGEFNHVTADSGSGKLFSELERFAAENEISAI